jgi:putative sterol carrier protein
VIEMDADTWLALANGETNWAAAMATGKINASGARADLSEYLPLAPNRITP